MRIEESPGNIVALSDIRERKQRALSPFGPLKVGLITWQDREIVRDDQLHQLSELLNSLESIVDSLNYKSFAVYDTLLAAIEDLRATLYYTIVNTDGTNE